MLANEDSASNSAIAANHPGILACMLSLPLLEGQTEADIGKEEKVKRY